MITIFENFKEPDLRKIGSYVLCVKNYKKNFTEGKYYKVNGMFGDPQRAIEEFGINEFVPVECISKILILTDKNKKKDFFINKEYYKNPAFFSHSKNFFEYFDIPKFSDKIDKFNI
jgi:hypothetical protein